MLKLTTMEMTLVHHTLNYKTDRDSQLSDNFSDATPKDIMEKTGWSRHQVAGVLSSLDEKNIGHVIPEEYNCIYLTEFGINTYFDNLEAMKQNTASEPTYLDLYGVVA